LRTIPNVNDDTAPSTKEIISCRCERCKRVADIGNAQKGKHTTTTAELIRLSFGGYVVDTPGLRQFMLWDIIPEEVFGLFRDLRPYENRCHFPDCTHSHEEDCAVKIAVGEGRLDLRRYESYLSLRFGK